MKNLHFFSVKFYIYKVLKFTHENNVFTTQCQQEIYTIFEEKIFLKKNDFYL